VITTTRTTRRATKTSTTTEQSAGRGVPQRVLADGVVERRRTPRRANEASVAAPPAAPFAPRAGELLPELMSPAEHYRLEMRRRGGRTPGSGDLMSLLAEAKAEYEAMLAAPRPAGKGGRPKKKPAPKPDEIELDDADALEE
jgi:hypothetical protein